MSLSGSLEGFDPDAIDNSWRAVYMKIEFRVVSGMHKELVRRGLPFSSAFWGQFLSVHSEVGAIPAAFDMTVYFLPFSSDHSQSRGKTQEVCPQSMSRSPCPLNGLSAKGRPASRPYCPLS